MSDPTLRPHRRGVIALCAAAAIAAAGPPPASAEPEAPQAPALDRPRPWADFEGMRRALAAEPRATTPALARAFAVGWMGPLPWSFDLSAQIPDTVVTIDALYDMATPGPGEELGVWALAHYASRDGGPRRSRLISLGRIVLKPETHAALMLHAHTMMASYEWEIGRRRLEGVDLNYTLLDCEGVIRSITLDSVRYQGAIYDLIREIERDVLIVLA